MIINLASEEMRRKIKHINSFISLGHPFLPCPVTLNISTIKVLKNALIRREISSVLCDHLEGWDREDGRETQEGGDMGTYVYV